MNPTNKKPFGARGVPQPFKPATKHASQLKPAIAQLKTAGTAQSVKRPVAPPVYRPQQGPGVLQKKGSSTHSKTMGQAPRGPIAPPVYRPEVKKVVQPKAISQIRQTERIEQVRKGGLPQLSKTPTAPAVYRPEQKRVAQPKMASAKTAHTSPKGPGLGRSTTVQKRPATGVPPLRGSRPGVIQRVMAYRVEYPPYKVQYNAESSKVTAFTGVDDGYGINISFVSPDHSTYFASERSEEQLKGLRLVTFELDDDLWAAIEWKTSNKGKKKDIKQKWLEKVESLKKPSWSDGASLTKFIKQTALGFEDKWLPVLKAGVKGTASVEYYEDNEDGLKDEDKVFGYLDGAINEGAEMTLREANDYYDGFITLGKARRLGYIR